MVDVSDIKKEFGKKVRRYRQYAKMTQEELADIAGITPQTLSGIENGYGFPSFTVLCKLIEALDVAPVCLFTFPYHDINNMDEEEANQIFLEDFRELNSENRDLVIHMMKYLREQQ